MASGESFSIATAKQAVDTLVKYIETQFRGFNISEVIKAGSLGDGTAVPGHYDLDLVIYSRGFTGMDVRRSGRMFEPWLRQLKELIERVDGVTLMRQSKQFSVQFSFDYNHQGSPVDVDLLISPYWNNPEELYNFLRSVPQEERMNYSVCASKWQREFFRKRVNQAMKEYIRRAKVWRNREWMRSTEGRPKSYLMSLLVVKAYEIADRQGIPVNAQRITSALVGLVRSGVKDVYWADGPDDFYRRADYKDLLPSRPRIIDPANPTNNVWESGFIPQGNSSILISRIHTIDLSHPVD